ncbi:acyl-CoA thioesterase [Pedobacter sp.]|jgi:acyl-CoA thioester hydrolase|uniref:acyl-CoA thioesterase n=1 Tax=Pedobacter sp. TaxID=1411316 RepID=UPI0018ED0661|nr:MULTISPECIES: acyl-CoA thioesterase [unclassified Pedobacter]HWW37791.1 acyl-CoA thioesterase [Pedobacter sp.]
MIFKTLWHSKEKQTDKKAVKMNELDLFKYKTTLELRFADYDMMGHVNNAVYFTYLEIARAKYWKQAIKWDWKKTGVVIAQASLDYIHPILLEDKVHIYVRTSRIGKTSFDLEYIIVKTTNNTELICSKGKTICVAFDYQTKAATEIPENEKNKMIVFEQLNNN